MQPPFHGVAVALLTLFDDDGALDAPATADLASRLVDAGVTAVVVAGTTGEASFLDASERVTLLDVVVDRVAGRVPVVAGTGAATTPQAAAFTADAVAHGADAVLALSPPGASDPRHYYEEVSRSAGDIPVLAYHYPKVSAPGIAVEALPDLPVAGLKDSTGDAERLLHELEVFDRPLYTGSPAILTLAGPLGCAGAILGLANAAPELCAAALAGDAEAQRALGGPIRQARDGFPHGLKRLAAERWGTSTACRSG